MTNKIPITFFVAVMSLWAQQPPNLFIFGSSREIGRQYLNESQAEKINNDFAYCSTLGVTGDSVATDMVTFRIGNIDNVLIRKLSFSRKGHIYCSAESFAARDSAIWKLQGNGLDSLSLNDSILSLKPKDPNRGFEFSWRLSQRFVFCTGDTFRLLLDEIPGIYPVKIRGAAQLHQPATSVLSRQGKKMILQVKEPGRMENKAQVRVPIFDLFGKRHSAAQRASAVYINP